MQAHLKETSSAVSPYDRATFDFDLTHIAHRLHPDKSLPLRFKAAAFLPSPAHSCCAVALGQDWQRTSAYRSMQTASWPSRTLRATGYLPLSAWVSEKTQSHKEVFNLFEVRQLRQLLERHHFFHVFSIDDPGGITVDAFLATFLSRRAGLSVRTALDVWQTVGRTGRKSPFAAGNADTRTRRTFSRRCL